MVKFNNIYTFENIQKAKLGAIPGGLDTREGSVIWNTIAVNSIEMALAYMQMQINQDNSFPDTANRENLIRHCALRGITPKVPTYAKIQGVFYSNVVDDETGEKPLFNPTAGTMFTVENTTLVYTVTNQISDGNWELVCNTAGNVGNISSGMLVPVEEIQSLGNANIVSILDAGEDEEDTEVLRARYMQSLEAQAFGGNKTAYRDYTKSIENIGACKVYRAYNGQAGHVGLGILNAELDIPSDELVASVQEIIDPTQDGEGVGYAPIDHIVHVFPATNSEIDVYLEIVPVHTTTTWENISQTVTEVINAYFLQLKSTWDTAGTPIIVRPAQIMARLLSIDMILDIAECRVNGGTTNVQLGENEVPKVGEVSGKIVQSA